MQHIPAAGLHFFIGRAAGRCRQCGAAMLDVQNSLRQQLELDRDAAVHKQQLEIDRQAHAVQLVQEAHTAAQTESDRLRKKHAQEFELSEVTQLLTLTQLMLTSGCGLRNTAAGPHSNSLSCSATVSSIQQLECCDQLYGLHVVGIGHSVLTLQPVSPGMISDSKSKSMH